MEIIKNIFSQLTFSLNPKYKDEVQATMQLEDFVSKVNNPFGLNGPTGQNEAVEPQRESALEDSEEESPNKRHGETINSTG